MLGLLAIEEAFKDVPQLSLLMDLFHGPADGVHVESLARHHVGLQVVQSAAWSSLIGPGIAFAMTVDLIEPFTDVSHPLCEMITQRSINVASEHQAGLDALVKDFLPPVEDYEAREMNVAQARKRQDLVPLDIGAHNAEEILEVFSLPRLDLRSDRQCHLVRHR